MSRSMCFSSRTTGFFMQMVNAPGYPRAPGLHVSFAFELKAHTKVFTLDTLHLIAMAFYRPLPKFNLHSFAVEDSSRDKLLSPQYDALQRLKQFFQQNPVGRIALVCMPTGSGKSGVISCLPYFLGTLGLNPPPAPDAAPYGEPLHKFDKPVLVIAPDLAIASQLEGVLTVAADAPGESFLIKRGIVPLNYHYVLPNGTKLEETSHVRNPEFLQGNEVIIANAQKFLQANWEDALPDDMFKLVIVDEAHHHPAETWRRIISKFKDHAIVVFFTATPFRGDGLQILGNTEGEIVSRLSLKEARELRIIRRTNWVREDDLDNISPFQLILLRVSKIQDAKNERNPLPGKIPHMAIAITKNIADAEQVRDMWNNFLGEGYPDSAIAYHSDVPKGTKMAMMKAIKDNQVKLVVVVDMLLEGFDHPPISIAAIMTRIVSPVKFAQFIGRAQRIVRGPEGLESAEIRADVVTHSYFQQEKNYQAFEKESLIPVTPGWGPPI